MHVSTAFNNLDKEVVDEIIYKSETNPVKLAEFIDAAENDLVNRLTPG